MQQRLTVSQEFATRLHELRDLNVLLMAASRLIPSAYKVADEVGCTLGYSTVTHALACFRQAEKWFRSQEVEVIVCDDASDLLLKEGERYYKVVFFEMAGAVELIPVYEPVLQQG
jgi:hypothetical protein